MAESPQERQQRRQRRATELHKLYGMQPEEAFAAVSREEVNQHMFPTKGEFPDHIVNAADRADRAGMDPLKGADFLARAEGKVSNAETSQLGMRDPSPTEWADYWNENREDGSYYMEEDDVAKHKRFLSDMGVESSFDGTVWGDPWDDGQ